MTLPTRLWLGMLGLCFASLALLITLRICDNRDVARYWRALDTNALEETFTRDMVADLPEPAQRYFLQAIEPGTPLATSVRLRVRKSKLWSGEGPRQELIASGIVSPKRGFVWEGRLRTSWGYVALATGSLDNDRIERESFMGLLPLRPTRRSLGLYTEAEQRLFESVFCPAALLPLQGVRWEAVDSRTVRAIIGRGSKATTLTLTIDDNGRLRKIRHDADDTTVFVLDYTGFDGYTIPTHVQIGRHRQIVVEGGWFKY
ncbi:MAG: DUF6544 family protein [Bradymonadaceae bacterium]